MKKSNINKKRPSKSQKSRRPLSTSTRVMRRSETQEAKQELKKRSVKTNGDVVRWCALGGLEEIGRNMMFLEYKDEIVVVDAGLQFPEEETPGIDYIIPNTSYLEVKKKNIRGMIITHGHYDHIGAIPYIMEQIGNPTIYATKLTRDIILKRQSDFSNAPKLNFELIEPGDVKKFSSNLSVEFFGVEHNIPEGVGMIFDTPIGKIVHPGEFKFDYDQDGKPRGMDVWESVGKKGIHTLMLDSTGATTPGWSVSERIVEEELEKLFKSAQGRVIVGTFSSLLDRLYEIIKIAERLGRVIAVSGYSMKTNIDIARNLGFIKTEKNTFISLNEIKNYKDDKIMILCTGAQGEKNASLMRMANGEHKQIKVKNTDTIILSSSIVPGNERSIQSLKDNLARQGPTIYDYKMLDIHSSGHAPQEELKTVMKLVNPQFFMPIHGYYFMRQQNAKMAQEVLGIDKGHTIIADNGWVVEFSEELAKVIDEQIPASYVLVDGLGVGDVGEVVLRDRRMLAEEGMVVIITVLSRKSGRILKNPDIISRGFIYLRENKELLNDIRRKIRSIVQRIPNRQNLDVDYLKTLIRDQIGSYLFKKTQRRPMVLPVIIEV